MSASAPVVAGSALGLFIFTILLNVRLEGNTDVSFGGMLASLLVPIATCCCCTAVDMRLGCCFWERGSASRAGWPLLFGYTALVLALTFSSLVMLAINMDALAPAVDWQGEEETFYCFLGTPPPQQRYCPTRPLSWFSVFCPLFVTAAVPWLDVKDAALFDKPVGSGGHVLEKASGRLFALLPNVWILHCVFFFLCYLKLTTGGACHDWLWYQLAAPLWLCDFMVLGLAYSESVLAQVRPCKSQAADFGGSSTSEVHNDDGHGAATLIGLGADSARQSVSPPWPRDSKKPCSSGWTAMTAVDDGSDTVVPFLALTSSTATLCLVRLLVVLRVDFAVGSSLPWAVQLTPVYIFLPLSCCFALCLTRTD